MLADHLNLTQLPRKTVALTFLYYTLYWWFELRVAGKTKTIITVVWIIIDADLQTYRLAHPLSEALHVSTIIHCLSVILSGSSARCSNQNLKPNFLCVVV